jgi:hypothetical protein
MAERFVVTGSGRCGTSWISHALTRAGIPCGHERVFGADGAGPWPDDLTGDSSWMAATWLDRVDVPVALLVRHPLSVVKSWVEIGFFTWDHANPTHRPLREVFPQVYGWRSPEDRALAMWTLLNRRALGRAEMVVRLEEMGPALMARLIGWTGADDPAGRAALALEVPPRNRHESSRERTGIRLAPSWDRHDPVLAARARSLAGILGYERED